MEYTIKDLCEQFGLSRSTLLYYDSIGLLKPAKRTEANYRKYTENDVKRLERICMYRQTGLPLMTIKQVLKAGDSEIRDALEEKYKELSNQIRFIRLQQEMLFNMLQNEELLKQNGLMDKEAFTQLLHQIGLSEDNMERLHTELERRFPEWHRRFLEMLSLDEAEVKEIRARSKGAVR